MKQEGKPPVQTGEERQKAGCPCYLPDGYSRTDQRQKELLLIVHTHLHKGSNLT